VSIAEVDSAVKAEEALRRSLKSFTDEWVATRDHKVVAHADSLEELLEQIAEEDRIDGVFHVPEEGASAAFF
jgi:hypothetical protein